MADIKIDIGTNIDEIGKSVDELSQQMVKDVQTAVGQLSRNVENEAIRLAQERLFSTSNHYIQSIKREQVGDNVWVISIDDEFSEHLENGFNGFDMKPGFLKSDKAKKDKDGNSYLDVPIQQHPFSKQKSSTKVTDMRSAVESVLKDNNVKKRVEEFDANSKGLSRYGNVTRFSNIKDRRVAGLVKITPPGSKSGQYLLFRRVSKNSPQDSWNHPGYQGANIFPDLEKYAKKQLDVILKNILGG